MLRDEFDDDEQQSDPYLAEQRTPNEIQPRYLWIGQPLKAENHCKICGGDFNAVMFTQCPEICDTCLVEIDPQARQRSRFDDPLYERLHALQALVHRNCRLVRKTS